MMAARTVPTIPNWFAGQKLTGTAMNAISTVQTFWANPPMFRMYQSAAQSIPNSAFTQVIMDTLDYDTDSGRSGASPYSYVIPAGMTGRWQFTYKAQLAVNTTGVRAVELYRNGSSVGPSEDIGVPSSSAASNIEMVTTITVNAGDVMAVYAFQSSGGALNTDVTSPSFFEGRLVSLANP